MSRDMDREGLMKARTGARALLASAALAALTGAGCASAPSSHTAAGPTPVPDSVTVAYGRMARARVTDAVTSLEPEAIDKGNAMRIEDLIQGRISGVQVARTA